MTSFLHQIRDQALHVLIYVVALTPLILFPTWYTALWAGAFLGAVREGEQWNTLNSPSVKDSVVDWVFCLVGSQVAWWGSVGVLALIK